MTSLLRNSMGDAGLRMSGTTCLALRWRGAPGETPLSTSRGRRSWANTWAASSAPPYNGGLMRQCEEKLRAASHRKARPAAKTPRDAK